MKDAVPFMCILAMIGIAVAATIGPADRHFWYPIKLMHAECTNYSGDVYLMKNSIGWRSWPYFLDIEDRVEVALPNACALKTLRTLSKPKQFIQNNLTAEQRAYLIEGF